MRKLAFLFLFFALPAFAQDVPVNCSNPTCTITPTGGIPWSQGNQIFIFRPIDPRVSVYIFVHNLNPSNAHTSQTITVWQTPFDHGTAPSLSQNSSRWTQDVVTQNGTAGASCNNVNPNNDLSIGASGLGTCFVTTMFASQVAIRITGAASQAGSPDTFELAVIQEVAPPGGQTPGSSSTVAVSQIQNFAYGCTNNPGSPGNLCGSGASDGDGLGNFLSVTPIAGSSLEMQATTTHAFNGTTWDRVRGTAKTGVASVPAIQEVSDGLSQSFVNQESQTTATSAWLFGINANSGGHSLYFDSATVSCTASCQIVFQTMTNTGTACGAGTAIQNMKVGNAAASTALANTGTCTTNPTGLQIYNLFLIANTPYTIDLKGFIATNGGTTGIGAALVVSASTTAIASVKWHEE